jgi:hypothetical protein
MYNWLIQKCRESNTLAWILTGFGIAIMIIIALI